MIPCIVVPGWFTVVACTLLAVGGGFALGRGAFHMVDGQGIITIGTGSGVLRFGNFAPTANQMCVRVGFAIYFIASLAPGTAVTDGFATVVGVGIRIAILCTTILAGSLFFTGCFTAVMRSCFHDSLAIITFFSVRTCIVEHPLVAHVDMVIGL